MELVFIVFTDCTRLLGWGLDRSLCQLASHWLLHLHLQPCEILPRSHRILLYASLPTEGRQYCCTRVVSLKGHCVNAKQWYHLRWSYEMIWALFHAQGFQLKPLKSWNKELCCLATPRQGPGVQRKFPFSFFSIGNSLQWRTVTGFCSLIRVVGWLSDAGVRVC